MRLHGKLNDFKTKDRKRSPKRSFSGCSIFFCVFIGMKYLILSCDTHNSREGLGEQHYAGNK